MVTWCGEDELITKWAEFCTWQAYVTQEDVLIGTLTVRESITYSADLRLPGKMTKAEKKKVVDNTIMEMGLSECENSYVGNFFVRGLSGGEKRRLSIALQILTRPRLLFLDEPTSGLDRSVPTTPAPSKPLWTQVKSLVVYSDAEMTWYKIFFKLRFSYGCSASAYFVVQTLKNLARDGRTVISSIHQPSSEVYALFDYLTLLSYGRTIFFGEAASAAEVNHSIPRHSYKDIQGGAFAIWFPKRCQN